MPYIPERTIPDPASARLYSESRKGKPRWHSSMFAAGFVVFVPVLGVDLLAVLDLDGRAAAGFALSKKERPPPMEAA
jgi:hypothetical protein